MINSKYKFVLLDVTALHSSAPTTANNKDVLLTITVDNSTATPTAIHSATQKGANMKSVHLNLAAAQNECDFHSSSNCIHILVNLVMFYMSWFIIKIDQIMKKPPTGEFPGILIMITCTVVACVLVLAVLQEHRTKNLKAQTMLVVFHVSLFTSIVGLFNCMLLGQDLSAMVLILNSKSTFAGWRLAVVSGD